MSRATAPRPTPWKHSPLPLGCLVPSVLGPCCRDSLEGQSVPHPLVSRAGFSGSPGHDITASQSPLSILQQSPLLSLLRQTEKGWREWQCRAPFFLLPRCGEPCGQGQVMAELLPPCRLGRPESHGGPGDPSRTGSGRAFVLFEEEERVVRVATSPPGRGSVHFPSLLKG